MATHEPEYFKSELPEGRSGGWQIEKFVVGEPGPDDGRPDWFRAPPGTYTRLKHGQTVFMTDLYDEWWTPAALEREWANFRMGSNPLGPPTP